MKQYVIAFENGSTERYVTALYRSSISSDEEISQAIKCDTAEEAKGLLSLCTPRATDKTFYVIAIETTISKVIL